MSRSYRKTTIFGNTTSVSEKSAKKIWHRMYRVNNKQNIKRAIVNDSFDDMVDIRPEEILNVYLLPKDGKQYWSKKDMNIKIEKGLVDENYIRKIMSK